MNSRSVWTITRAATALALCLAAGCRSAPPDRPSKAAPPDIELSRCVIHAGETQRSSHRVKGPGGQLGAADAGASCWLNAECVARQGVVTPADGDVTIACQAASCTCTLQPHAPGASSTSFSFPAANACESQARLADLLNQRCRPGTNPGATRSEAARRED